MFPLKHRYLDILRMLPAQLRRATGQIQIPPQAASGDYDLVVIGSPTWWLTTCMPIRSYLKSPEAARFLKGRSMAGFVVCRRYWKNNLHTVQKLAEQNGATCVGTTHFAYLGGQVRSLLSLISYLGTGENRERYFGDQDPAHELAARWRRSRASVRRETRRHARRRHDPRKAPDAERRPRETRGPAPILFRVTRTVLGHEVQRVEDPALLTGEAQFLAHLRVEGLVHAVFVRSTVAHGTLRSVDTAGAAGLPDVVAALTADDLDLPEQGRAVSARWPVHSSRSTASGSWVKRSRWSWPSRTRRRWMQPRRWS